jgi:hypothetical protein
METLTFYRKLANTNHELMKKYKVAVINKMKYDEILNLYKINNLNFDEDIQRLKNFYNKSTEVTLKEKPEEKPEEKLEKKLEKKPEELSKELDESEEKPIEYIEEKVETSWFKPSYLLLLTLPILSGVIYFNYSKINIYINGN